MSRHSQWWSCSDGFWLNDHWWFGHNTRLGSFTFWNSSLEIFIKVFVIRLWLQLVLILRADIEALDFLNWISICEVIDDLCVVILSIWDKILILIPGRILVWVRRAWFFVPTLIFTGLLLLFNVILDLIIAILKLLKLSLALLNFLIQLQHPWFELWFNLLLLFYFKTKVLFIKLIHLMLIILHTSIDSLSLFNNILLLLGYNFKDLSLLLGLILLALGAGYHVFILLYKSRLRLLCSELGKINFLSWCNILLLILNNWLHLLKIILGGLILKILHHVLLLVSQIVLLILPLFLCQLLKYL